MAAVATPTSMAVAGVANVPTETVARVGAVRVNVAAVHAVVREADAARSAAFAPTRPCRSIIKTFARYRASSPRAARSFRAAPRATAPSISANLRLRSSAHA